MRHETDVPDSIEINSTKTEELNAEMRASIVALCIAAHHNSDFQNLFSYAFRRPARSRVSR